MALPLEPRASVTFTVEFTAFSSAFDGMKMRVEYSEFPFSRDANNVVASDGRGGSPSPPRRRARGSSPSLERRGKPHRKSMSASVVAPAVAATAVSTGQMYRRMHLSLPVAVAASLTAEEFGLRRVGGSALKPALYDGIVGSGNFVPHAAGSGGGGDTTATPSIAVHGDDVAITNEGFHDDGDAVGTGSGGACADLNETHFLLTFTVKNETPGEFMPPAL